MGPFRETTVCKLRYSPRIQYPAILPSQPSNNRFIIYHSAFSSIYKIDSYCACSSKGVPACIFNEPQAVGLFLALDDASMHTDFFTSGKNFCNLVNYAVFIPNESLCFVSVHAVQRAFLRAYLMSLRLLGCF